MFHIENDWYLDADDYCYTLMRKTDSTDKNGNTIYKDLRYYPTIGAALKGYAEMKLRKITAEKDAELSQGLQALTKEVDRIQSVMDLSSLEALSKRKL